MLIAEEDDFPFQEGPANLLQLVWRQRLGEIDAANFRSDMEREGHDFDRALRPGIRALLR
jgi:hypothetical protein